MNFELNNYFRLANGWACPSNRMPTPTPVFYSVKVREPGPTISKGPGDEARLDYASTVPIYAHALISFIIIILALAERREVTKKKVT